ncbi:TRAP transporter small permease [Chloroflexota bacterium]
MDKTMWSERIEKFLKSFSVWLSVVAGLGLMGMLAITMANVIGIKLLKYAIPGGIEMVTFLFVVEVAFAMAYVQVLHENIRIELFVMSLPERAQTGLAALASLLGAILFGLLTWRVAKFAYVLQLSGQVSFSERIPYYPFAYALAFCCLPVFLLLLLEFWKSLMKVVHK